MNSGNSGGGSEIGGQSHVQGFNEPARVEHGGHGIDIGGEAVDEFESSRGVHPGIGGDHKDAGTDAAEGDQYSGQPMGAGGNAVPTVEIDTEEDGFGEEGEAFERERHADD